MFSMNLRAVGGASFAAFALILLSGCSSDDTPKDPVTRGRQAVTSRACEGCHTPTTNPSAVLSGSEVPYEKTQAYPPNLTPDEDTGIGTWDDDLILRAMMTGIDDEDAELCTTMPRFKDKGMTEDEAKDIIAYLHTLAPVKHSVPESSCPPIKGGEGGEGDGGK